MNKEFKTDYSITTYNVSITHLNNDALPENALRQVSVLVTSPNSGAYLSVIGTLNQDFEPLIDVGIEETILGECVVTDLGTYGIILPAIATAMNDRLGGGADALSDAIEEAIEQVMPKKDLKRSAGVHISQTVKGDGNFSVGVMPGMTT